MLSGTFVGGVVKVIVVGGLMAAATGGVYTVVSTRSESEDRSLVRVADTPTAEATSVLNETPSPESATSTPAPATPSPTDDTPRPAMLIAGDVWIDARPANTLVLAFVGDIECGSAKASSHDGYGSFFVLEVLSDTARPGCGTAGAIVNFTIGGQTAAQTAIWQEGQGPALVLTNGAVFAQYYGRFFYEGMSGSYKVEPLIDGQVCGQQINPPRGDGEYGYHVVVDSQELSPGCGRSGTIVTFRLAILSDGSWTEVPYEFPPAAWEPGTLVHLPDPAPSQTPLVSPTSQ